MSEPLDFLKIEMLAATMGEEKAAWARWPREEREKELRWDHVSFNPPDELAVWPPELGRGSSNAWRLAGPDGGAGPAEITRRKKGGIVAKNMLGTNAFRPETAPHL